MRTSRSGDDGSVVVLGASESRWRELHALADLRVLTRARAAVLWPGSSFSELAALHLAARNATVGWVADMRSTERCGESADKLIARSFAHEPPGLHLATELDVLSGAQFTMAGRKDQGALQPLRPLTGSEAASPCLSFMA